MLEKRWVAVPAQALTSDGTANGKITIADTTLFKVKQVIILESSSIAPRDDLEVKRIDDEFTMWIGPIKGNIDMRTNLSAYLVAEGATIAANEQKRSSVPEQEIERLTYEEEPVVARRVIGVDKQGQTVDWSEDGLVPQEFDDVQLTRDLDGDIVEAKFYLKGTLKRDLDLTYDLNKDLIRVKKVGP